MAEQRTGGAGSGEAHEPRECMACSGSGQVISKLGGSESRVRCPWCEGSGTRQPGHDAQARWLAERASASAASAGPAEPPKRSEPAS